MGKKGSDRSGDQLRHSGRNAKDKFLHSVRIDLNEVFFLNLKDVF